ncbi:MAG: hypothetical protein MPF33_02135 [Candidatus Aramenus sp.]|jgi:hypothetical protein|nr:hypothetical protein [Candidatus Aramenus sp.]
MDISSWKLITCVKKFYENESCYLSDEELLLIPPTEGLRTLDYFDYLELEGQPSLALKKFKNKLRGSIRKNLKVITPVTVASSMSFLLFYLPKELRRLVVQKYAKLELFGKVDKMVLKHRERVVDYVVDKGIPTTVVESVFRKYMDLERLHRIVWLTALLASGVRDLRTPAELYGDDVFEAERIASSLLGD